LPRWCAGIRVRCASTTARCGFTHLRGKFAKEGALSTEKNHELVLECLRQVTEQAIAQQAVMVEIVITLPNQISEFWTTNPAPLTMVRGKGSTH